MKVALLQHQPIFNFSFISISFSGTDYPERLHTPMQNHRQAFTLPLKPPPLPAHTHTHTSFYSYLQKCRYLLSCCRGKARKMKCQARRRSPSGARPPPRRRSARTGFLSTIFPPRPPAAWTPSCRSVTAHLRSKALPPKHYITHRSQRSEAP